MVERLGSTDQLIDFFTGVLKHEVQHAADLHEQESAPLGARSAANLLQYARIDFDTDYRAHAIMGLPEVLKASPEKNEPFLYDRAYTVTQRHNVLSRIAWKDIEFKYRRPAQDTESTQPFLSAGELGELFAYMATTRPMATAVNLLNSVRVDGFYRALSTRSPRRVVGAYLDLDSSDRTHLKEDPAAVVKVRSLIGAGVGEWNSDSALWSGLERMDRVVSATFSQAQMYGWSQGYVVEEGLKGSFDHLL
jgi:hypothetical protein